MKGLVIPWWVCAPSPSTSCDVEGNNVWVLLIKAEKDRMQKVGLTGCYTTGFGGHFVKISYEILF